MHAVCCDLASTPGRFFANRTPAKNRPGIDCVWK